MITLELTTPTTIPLEVAGIVPEQLRGLTAAQIARLPVQHGNRQEELGAFFKVVRQGDGDDLVWTGDLSSVHWIGAKLHSGHILIEGNAGRHIGSEMSGGSILITGDAGDWLGAQMSGGLIRVHQSAGDNVGGAYRGGLRGMTGGTILIDGNAGHEVGHSQRRGIIAVSGDVGDYAAINMLAGTLVVGGKCGKRPAAGMRRGTVLFLGPAPRLLPTFRYGCRYQPAYARMLQKDLATQFLSCPLVWPDRPWNLFHGDLLHGGRGEILTTHS